MGAGSAPLAEPTRILVKASSPASDGQRTIRPSLPNSVFDPLLRYLGLDSSRKQPLNIGSATRLSSDASHLADLGIVALYRLVGTDLVSERHNFLLADNPGSGGWLTGAFEPNRYRK